MAVKFFGKLEAELRGTMRHTKRNLPTILFLVLLLIGISTIICSNVVFIQTNPGDVLYTCGKVNMTFKPGVGMIFTNVSFGTGFVRLNGTVFRVESSKFVNITINKLAVNTTKSVTGDIAFNFTAKCSGGRVFFNLSGFNHSEHIKIYKNNTLLNYSIINSSGCISFNNSVWSWYYFTGIMGDIPPTVTTNTSTGAGATNCTLHGYVVDSGVKGATPGVWADIGYLYKKNITIDHTKVAQTVSNFPVLIRVNDTDLKSVTYGGHVQSNRGYDICFYDSTGTNRYYHEIENYTASSGHFVAWVNITSLSSTVDTVIGMYYGNASVTVNPSSNHTWDHHYVGVWHCNEAYGNLNDSTYTRNATASGIISYQQTNSIINRSVYFDGTDVSAGYFNITNESYIFSTQSVVLEAVVKFPDQRDLYDTVISMGSESTLYPLIRMHRIRSGYGDDKANNMACEQNVPPATSDWVWSDDDIDTGWHLVSARFSRGVAVSICIDGVHQAQEDSCVNNNNSLGVTFRAWIGRAAYTGSYNHYAKMYLDELRVSRATARGEQYSLTMYNTIFHPDTFMSYGSEQSYTGALPCKADFEYGTSALYGSNTTDQNKYTGETFEFNVSSLSPGMLYHYRARGNNSVGTGYGVDMTFLTHPNAPTGFTVVSNSSNITYASWTKGVGANNTKIIRKIAGFPSSLTDGKILCNTTVNHVSNYSMPGNHSYYKAWSYTNISGVWTWSTNNATTVCLTKPDAPRNKTAQIVSASQVNLSWTNGNGTNRTILVKKSGSYPKNIADGTVVYNGSKNYTTLTLTGASWYIRGWGFCEYNFSGGSTRWQVSSDNLSFNFSRMILTVFNESKPWQNISATIQLSNHDGTKTVLYTNVPTPYYINLESSTIPTGDNCVFVISNSSYKTRTYYKNLEINNLYNFSFYLPPIWTQSNGSGGTPGTPGSECTLRSITETISISNMAVNAVITTSHDIEEIISVEVYNDSLYGSYGGWIQVPSGQYSYNTSNVTIKYTALHDGTTCCNTTMGRVSYYYWYCPNQTIETALYRLRVVQSYAQDNGISDVIVHILRYFNTTGVYTEIAAPLTDANGYVNVWLIPGVFYKVNITKTGYEPMIADYITDPPNEWGQTLEKVFALVQSTTIIVHPDLFITMYGTLFSNNSIKICYQDIDSNTTDVGIFVYEMWNNLLVMRNHTNKTSISDFCVWLNISNSSRSHLVRMFVNHTRLGYVNNYSFIVPGMINQFNGTRFGVKMRGLLGNWSLDWDGKGTIYTMIIFVFLPMIIMLLGFAAVHHIEMGILFCGAYGSFVSSAILMTGITRIAVLAGLLLVFGFIGMVINRRMHQ